MRAVQVHQRTPTRKGNGFFCYFSCSHSALFVPCSTSLVSRKILDWGTYVSGGVSQGSLSSPDSTPGTASPPEGDLPLPLPHPRLPLSTPVRLGQMVQGLSSSHRPPSCTHCSLPQEPPLQKSQGGECRAQWTIQL